jgi:hypothetical protein
MRIYHLGKAIAETFLFLKLPLYDLGAQNPFIVAKVESIIVIPIERCLGRRVDVEVGIRVSSRNR